jgi:DNA-binding MltR family transcriptional regulator
MKSLNHFFDVDESIELLEGKNAVLGIFSARINACYCLGLIQENEFKELNIIRKIRNEFGHKWKDISFETRKINDLCFNLPWLGPIELEENGSSNAKSRFNMAVAILLTDLLWRPHIIQNEKRTSKIYRECKPLKLIAP